MDNFKILRYSFILAVIMLLMIFASMFFVITTFYDIEISDAITTGGPTNKNLVLGDNWPVAHIENVSGNIRHIIRNIDDGTTSAAFVSIFNDFGPDGVPTEIELPLVAAPDFHRLSVGITSTNFISTIGYGSELGLFGNIGPGNTAFINFFDGFFAWRYNPSDDGDLGNTVEAFRVEDGKMGIGTETPSTLLEVAGQITLEDDVYDSSWDGLLQSPTKNAVFDKIETINGADGDISVKVTKTTDQSIPQNSLTMVNWDSEEYDTDGMHDNVTNNSRITFQTAGKYSILAQSEWGINSGGFRFMDIMKNGVDSIARVRNLAENASEHNIAFVGEFAVGDYIQLEVFQDTGGNLDFESGAIIENTYLEAHKID